MHQKGARYYNIIDNVNKVTDEEMVDKTDSKVNMGEQRLFLPVNILIK